MATATCQYDPGYFPYSTDLKYLLDLPKKEEISANITQYNTAQPREAMRVLKEAARNGQRVEIIGWDSDTKLMIPFVTNPGHGKGHGISADYFLDEMAKHKKEEHVRGPMAGYLSRELINSSDFIDRGHIDFFQINVHH